MPEELAVITNPGTAYGRRRRYWRELWGEVPDGMLVDVNCGCEGLCINRAHLYLRPKVNLHERYGYKDYKGIRERAFQLEDGEFFDLADEPNDPKSVVKFRCGFGASSHKTHFLIRKLPTGGLRIIRHGSYYQPVEEYLREFPVLFNPRAVPAHRRPYQFFLGFLWNTAEQFIHLPKCTVKACPMPQSHGRLCNQHKHWFEFPISMTDSALDLQSIYRPSEPYSPYTLAAEFPRKMDSLEKSLKFIRDSVSDARHRNAGDAGSIQSSPSMRRMGHGKGRGSSKTSRGRARTIARSAHSANHRQSHDPIKRWSREELELEANRLLGEEPIELDFVPLSERDGGEIYRAFPDQQQTDGG